MLIVLLGLFSVVLGVPAPGHGALKGYCITDDHCKKNKCCVSFVLPGEPRTDGDDVTRFVNGTCEKLQTKYEVCVIPSEETSATPGLHFLHCPCKKKYTCVPNGQTSSVGQLGECRPWCKSTKKCRKDECCVEADQPGQGKKRRGVCRPMGVQGAACSSCSYVLLELHRRGGTLAGECCVEGKGKICRGVCRPMDVQGAACLNINGSGRPSGIVRHSCPCLSQYNCGPIVTTDPDRVDTCGFFIG